MAATLVRGVRLPRYIYCTRSLCLSSIRAAADENPNINRALDITTYTRSSVDGKNVDKVTHTGQVWDKDDYRRVRFIDKDKLVNEQVAMDLIAADPVVISDERNVWSDSGGPLGHPRVFINLDKPEVAVCGYSGRKFIYRKFYDAAKHGPSISYEDYIQQVRPT